jgi:hypothetical protein
LKLAAVVAFVLVAGMVARMGYERSVSPAKTERLNGDVPFPIHHSQVGEPEQLRAPVL